ncbi:hypothetical protein GGP91_003338 [Salinibacter ruber]|uniref:hypothetical protein n=1 Tax=Salinibacter ruber TaxID=146919 RepID=UPI00216A4209|nr:hypothetical protein [Salinibacter ruber]MCS3831237.1 hypothetical protein [Salinibacter ruber]
MTDSSGEKTFCNARKRGNGDLEKAEPGPYAGDGYCKQRTGGGRCRMHGRDAGEPPAHGLYSDLRDDLQEYVDDALALDAPGDLQGELAVLRALVKRWLDNAGDLDKEAIDAAHKLLSEVRRTSDTIHKQLQRERLTKQEEEKLFATFAKIIRQYVPEGDRDDALDQLESVAAGGGRRALESEF